MEVIPHGVDRSIFRVLDPSTRKQYRALFGASEEDFIILNVGAMTANKGIDVLLDAFFILFKKYQNIKLVLKDQSNLYGIRARDLVFERSSKKHPLLSAAEVQQAISKICFVTDNLSLTQLNGLYNAADCYASPYRAEGFNLTPLEAAAAGTPIVITKGGSTDDYFDPSFAVQIEANKVNLNNQHYLEPNYESLLEGIESILTKKKDFNKLKGVEFLEKNFSWDVVCGKLYTTLMG